jgi:hypothetical protein
MGALISFMLAAWLVFFGLLYRNPEFIRRIRSWKIYRFRHVVLVVCLIANVNTWSAVQSLFKGPEYDRQLCSRYETIARMKSQGARDITVPSLTAVPPLLYFRDAAESYYSDDYKAFGINQYFGIDMVRADGNGPAETRVRSCLSPIDVFMSNRSP